ncbi:endo-1,4-beta-xylanase [Reichenbachiella sp.]|uniref:endo-1,4-beta-xylanase n=1 Tax=Reichenbachiella sp. TaxID=2184521 RepID=UPI00329832B8
MWNRLILILPVTAVVFSCTRPKLDSKDNLRNYYREDFKIGAALSADDIVQKTPLESKLISEEFNTLTAENVMKWEEIHPLPDVFEYDVPDELIKLAKINKQEVIGHTLVWHNQLPEWVVQDEQGNLVDSTTLFQHIENHINAVANRYSGDIKGWDVVNEAISDQGGYRNSKFYQISGKEFIFKAFEYAAKADPEAELYYNDYSMYRPEKCDDAIRLATEIRKRGLRIDGIGMQAHWQMNSPTIEQIETSILKIHKAGFQIHFTELDIDVLPYAYNIEGANLSDNFESNPKLNPYKEGLPDSLAEAQGKRYQEIFKLFYKHGDKIERVTFWGLDDGSSWKNDWPAKGRTNYPLLFDRDFKPKKAYEMIMSVKKEPT